MNASQFHWPGNNRIAVAVTVAVETWGEGLAPSYSPMTTALKPGTVDRANISWAGYGGKHGIWRLLRILNENQVPASFCANAKIAELFPEAMKAVVRSGHEVAAHSYTQDMALCYMAPDEEQAVIKKSLSIIGDCIGKRAQGWISPMMATTERTSDLLIEEGLLWHGDYNDIDLPFRVKGASGSIVAIPHSDFADNRVLRASPHDFFQAYKDTFDYLYASEPMSFLNVTLHAHFGGRPLIASVFDNLLRYFSRFPNVWFARHDEIADWVNRHKYEEVLYHQRFSQGE